MDIDEIRSIVHQEMALQRDEFVRKSWYILIGLFVTTASAWFSLYFQVQNISNNTFSSQEGKVLEQQLTNLQKNYERDVVEIKADVRYIREKLEK